jgi:hypothetical protein
MISARDLGEGGELSGMECVTAFAMSHSNVALQNASTVWSMGTQPVIPAVYGVKAPL